MIIARLLLLTAAVSAWAQTSNVEVIVTKEKVPAGAFAQVKVFLKDPLPIRSGNLFVFMPYLAQTHSATVFSASGDVSATARYNPSGYSLSVHFDSPSSGVGRLPGLPILQFSVPVSKTLDVYVSGQLYGPDFQPYAVPQTKVPVEVGGSLSVTRVFPSGETGILPAGSIIQIEGTGFTPQTSVAVDGTKLDLVEVQSPTLIKVRLAFTTEMTAKRVRVRNPDGTAIDVWGGALPGGNVNYTFPLSASSKLSSTWSGPDFNDPTHVAIQNPNPIPATVSITRAYQTLSPTPILQTVNTTIPAGGLYTIAIDSRPTSVIESSPDTPVRASIYVLTAYSFDFLTRVPLAPSGTSSPRIATVVNAASLSPAPVSPGELITIFGTNITPTTRVFFNQREANIVYRSASQINVIAAAGIFGVPESFAIQLDNEPAQSFASASGSPGIFTLAGSGVGNAIALNEGGSINTLATPGRAGSVITVFLTGVSNPELRIAGRPAEIVARQRFDGLLQLLARIPESAPSGAVEVLAIENGVQSQPGVTLAIR